MKNFLNDKKMARIVVAIAIAVLTLLIPLFSHAAGNYGQATDIFNVGAGARAMGMGGAFTAVSDDASAPYFNPSGLAYLDEHQLMAMHAPMMLDSNYNYFATANPFGDKWGTVALSDALLLSDGYELRGDANELRSSNASLSNGALSASYAHKLPMNLAAGINAKLIQQKVAGFSDSALGLDVGFIYKPMDLLSVGASFANINSPEITLSQSPDKYQPVSKLGVASNVFKHRLLLSADMIRGSHSTTRYATGLEYMINPMFALRTGFNASRSYTFGIGVNLKQFRIDYAFSNTDIGAFNKFSFTWAWHNIYKTNIEPPMKEGRAVYPLEGFDNKVVFANSIPPHTVANWSLRIKDKTGATVRTLSGDLRPPEKIVWDARNQVGEPVVDGTYSYDFQVNYKNGKSWDVPGDINLVLPNHKQEEVIDMNLQLNGNKAAEDEHK